MIVRSGSVPKYRRHKSSGQAFVQVKGKRYHLGVYGSAKSKEAYARFIDQLIRDPEGIEPQKTADADALTVVELAAKYLDYAVEYYKKNGVTTPSAENVRRVLLLLNKFYGTQPAKDFGPRSLLQIQEHLAAKKLSRSYINDVCGTIRRCFKWGVSRELIPPSVHHGLSAVEGLRQGRSQAREPDPILPVDDAVVEATLPYLPPVVVAMVRLERITGARPGEICQLRPIDVDRACNPGNGEVWRYRPASHKTEHHGKERDIFIGPKGQAVLLPWLERDPAAYCFSPAESEDLRHAAQRSARKTPVQPSQQHRGQAMRQRPPATCYTKDSYRRAIARAVTRANKEIRKAAAIAGAEPKLLPDWHPNQLRHTLATEIRRLYGLEGAQIILSHSRADVTQIYAERDRRRAVEIMKQAG